MNWLVQQQSRWTMPELHESAEGAALALAILLGPGASLALWWALISAVAHP